MSTAGSLTRSFQVLLYRSVLSVLPALDDLHPAVPLQAYFILQPRVRFTLQGFSLLLSRRISSIRRALLMLSNSASKETEISNSSSGGLIFRALLQVTIRYH